LPLLPLSRPIEFQSRLLDYIQRNIQQIAFWQFQPDLSFVNSLKTSTKNFLLMQRDSGLNSGQLTVEASVVTFLDQLAIQPRGGNFQRVRKRNQIFNIEYRSYLLADQLAIAVGYALRLIDEDTKDRALACSLELCVNQFISLTFDYLLNEPPYPVPLDSHAHNNKKVGETPTQRFLFEYRYSTSPNQPVNLPALARARLSPSFDSKNAGLFEEALDHQEPHTARKSQGRVVFAIREILRKRKRTPEAQGHPWEEARNL
jgi:hypothetical protein